MDSQKQQLIEKLQGATNILVTVSSNPTVDQLAACIGMTLMLNEAGKRGTAVYSGETPSTIEFLQPTATIEKTTDSLRDFIISLDMSKADKLRYKKEDKVVKIFITPYRTSLSDKDLVFSQGDFNIDVIVALGVHRQEDLDQAITAHGRILHDATVITVNNTPDGSLGSINWQDLSASSLSEQVASLAASFENLQLDQQTATALLTGIVAETERFSNAKTSAATMSIAAGLMAAGANQQLVASELDKPEPLPEPEPEPIVEEPIEEVVDQPEPAAEAETTEPALAPVDNDPTAMTFEHSDEPEETPSVEELVKDNQIEIDDNGVFKGFGADNDETESSIQTSGMIMDPPANNPVFTASTTPEDTDPATDPLGVVDNSDRPLLSHTESVQPEQSLELPSVDTSDNSLEKTLADIEADVQAEEQTERPSADDARSAIDTAIAASPNQPLEPIAALHAQPMAEVQPEPATDSEVVADAVSDAVNGPSAPASPVEGTLDMPLPPINPSAPPAMPPQFNAGQDNGPSTPPPGPPPMMPPFPQR